MSRSRLAPGLGGSRGSWWLDRVSQHRSDTLSERILALTTSTVTDTGEEIPHRFLLAIFEELGEMTVEMACECHKLKADFLDA
ncbi:hypothetical protein [Pandoraea sputorum]|uniref:hypothetical protein n=1 Tax=Pandoraea sputorum TaxID=93222 RepID=UPI001242EA35|nr:hypothetical protein [Pandoraea sputorum]VVE82366.1 hypothetical protein PSP31120_03598 [Pandoraea sputorum]